MQRRRKKSKTPWLLDTFLPVKKLSRRLKNSRSDDFGRGMQSWPEPWRCHPHGCCHGCSPYAGGSWSSSPAHPSHRDIACNQRSRPQESPGLAGLLGEEISNLSENQTAESEQREEKKKTQETKPKLTPFVIENTQCGESSLGGQHAFCRGNPK